VEPPFEKETINLTQRITFQEILEICYDVDHKSFDLSNIQEENLDDHKIFDCSSYKHNKHDEVREEAFLDNVFSHNCDNAREPFHFLLYNSFYYLYPNIFSSFGVPYSLSTLSCMAPS